MKLTYLKDTLKLLIKYIKGDIFYNYTIYEKSLNHVKNNGALISKSKSSFAIVVQGPLVAQDNFTMTTLKLYRLNFPDASIIFSTWAVSKTIVDELKKHAIIVLQNKPPQIAGISNLNMQIVTSKAGIIYAEKNGAQFILKTRSDQRIYHPSLDLYLFSLLRAFPLKSKKLEQTNRLIGISLDSQKYRIYGLSDMFLFGCASDMIKYWDATMDTRQGLDKIINIDAITNRGFSELCIGPVYLNTKFLEKIGHTCKWTLKDSFTVLKDRFIIVDQSAIKLLWHKYTINEERYSQFGFFDPEISFNDWLTLYSSINEINIDETILDNKFVVNGTT